MKKLTTIISFISILLILTGCPYRIKYYRFTEDDTENVSVVEIAIYQSDKLNIWYELPDEWNGSRLLISNKKYNQLFIRNVTVNYSNENGFLRPKKLTYQNNGTGVINTVKGTPDFSGKGLLLERDKFFFSETYLRHRDFLQNDYLIVNIDIELEVEGESISISREEYIIKDVIHGWYIGLD